MRATRGEQGSAGKIPRFANSPRRLHLAAAPPVESANATPFAPLDIAEGSIGEQVGPQRAAAAGLRSIPGFAPWPARGRCPRLRSGRLVRYSKGDSFGSFSALSPPSSLSQPSFLSPPSLLIMRFPTWFHRFFASSAAAGLCLLWPVWAAAAESDRGGKDGAGVWLMCYMVVFLFIVLGLMFLLRPSGRRDRPKMEQ